MFDIGLALVRRRTKLKNKIHSIVLMKGIQTSSKHCSFTHLYNEAVRYWRSTIRRRDYFRE